uniref:Uncharacterized protein n=1 Tax=Solanum tuberosum TaxID=4113 RepID=M0ZPG6_SOLTU
MKLQPQYFLLETFVLTTSSSGFPLSICNCSFTFLCFFLSPKRENGAYQGSTDDIIYDFSKCSM